MAFLGVGEEMQMNSYSFRCLKADDVYHPGTRLLELSIIMMRVLKFGMFSSFTRRKGGAGYVLLAQNAPYWAYYYYSFYCACDPVAPGHQLDLQAGCGMPLSKMNLGYGYSRTYNTARHQFMRHGSNCIAVLLDRRAGKGQARSLPGRQRCAC